MVCQLLELLGLPEDCEPTSKEVYKAYKAKALKVRGL